MNSIKFGRPQRCRLITVVVCCLVLCLPAWGNDAPAFKAEYRLIKPAFKCPTNGYKRKNRGETKISEVSAKRTLVMLDRCANPHLGLTLPSDKVPSMCFQNFSGLKSNKEKGKAQSLQFDLLEKFEASYMHIQTCKMNDNQQKVVSENLNILSNRMYGISHPLFTPPHLGESQQINNLVSSLPVRILLSRLYDTSRVSLLSHPPILLRCDIILNGFNIYVYAPPGSVHRSYFISDDTNSIPSDAEMDINLHLQKNVSTISCILGKQTEIEKVLKYACSDYENNRLPHGNIYKSRKVPKIRSVLIT